MEEVYVKVQKATEKHATLYWGTSVGSPELAKHVYEHGARFINVKGDFSAVYNGFSTVFKMTDQLINSRE